MPEIRSSSPASCADRAASFGASVDADRYDALRPSYPPEAVEWMLGGDGRARVLDLGAGTGKLTAGLVDGQRSVVAVDPSAPMLAVLRRTLPAVGLVRGRGEAIPLADSSVDAVTVGQAWHWMDHDAATGEVARVLRPGGPLAMAWNDMEDRVEWVAELGRLTTDPQTVGDARSAAAGRAVLAAPFGEAETLSVPWTQQLDGPEALVHLVSTWSWVALHPDRERVLEAVRRLAESVRHPDGTVQVPHRCDCFRWWR